MVGIARLPPSPSRNTSPTGLSQDDYIRVTGEFEHDVLTIRDILVPGHHALPRLVAAREAGVQAIWDLSHYHRNRDPVRCARIASEASLAGTGMKSCGSAL